MIWPKYVLSLTVSAAAAYLIPSGWSMPEPTPVEEAPGDECTCLALIELAQTTSLNQGIVLGGLVVLPACFVLFTSLLRNRS